MQSRNYTAKEIESLLSGSLEAIGPIVLPLIDRQQRDRRTLTLPYQGKERRAFTRRTEDQIKAEAEEAEFFADLEALIES